MRRVSRGCPPKSSVTAKRSGGRGGSGEQKKSARPDSGKKIVSRKASDRPALAKPSSRFAPRTGGGKSRRSLPKDDDGVPPEHRARIGEEVQRGSRRDPRVR
ncbi:hypothetical protein KM043_003868 [Ampulex compressa]|nr:hypothetical protein KM043_003868 [Ampulex compressa]